MAEKVEPAFERANHAVGFDPSSAVDVVVSSAEEPKRVLSEWNYPDGES